MENIYFSIILPVYNESNNIIELYEKLIQTLNSFNKEYELVFVDDGSTDNTYKILNELHLKDNRITVIEFSRNFGHHIAISAGIDYSTGDIIVIMDSDLQDRPEDIKLLYDKYREGFDVVYASSKNRGEGLFRRIGSKAFYNILSSICKIKINEDAGTFRMISRKVAVNLRNLNEKTRFMNGLIDWLGFSATKVEVQRDGRQNGKSKYDLWKLIKLTLDAIISFSYLPLRIAMYTGFTVSSLSLTYGSYIIIKKVFFGIGELGWPSLMVGILFIGGLQLISLGIIGEYVARIFTEAQNRPLYIVENILRRKTD